MSKESEKMVEKFLEEIKKNLPEWIKDNEEKVDDIILEIRSHIWDSAYEISGSDDPDSVSIEKAITRIGSPKEIAKSYKTRGTPKYFISEELWSTYKKIIYALIAIIFTLIVIVQIIIVEPNNLLQAIINSLILSLNSITIFVVIVTIIFFYLSAEGYFPEDLDSEGKIQSEREKFESKYYKPGELLFNGIAGITLGLLLIILPKDMIGLFRVILNWIIELLNTGTANYSDFNVSGDLIIWMTVSGIVTIITGIIYLMKIQTKDPEFHIGMSFFYFLAEIANLALVVYIWVNIELLLEVLPQLSENILLILLVLVIIGIVFDLFSTVSKSIKLFDLKNNSASSNN
ncbi:MAG: hypothetical protein HeimC3_51450 [Candidatus Heimdallarchaeota archaeon LC_3]|nr:MAG: hypothetical protein HeimC3_51450 [Candidatus Heimdallarchaeota archaeon LC_3]